MPEFMHKRVFDIYLSLQAYIQNVAPFWGGLPKPAACVILVADR